MEDATLPIKKGWFMLKYKILIIKLLKEVDNKTSLLNIIAVLEHEIKKKQD